MDPAAPSPAPPPVPPPADVPSPVTAAERIVAIDVVRGLAVLGILVMNVVEFGQPLHAYDNPAYAGGSSGLDLAFWFVQVTLFDGRMRALFSMLFGAGIVLIAERMASKGQEGRAADLLLRRCLWLVLFGIAHRFGLQWTGDILYLYGLIGLIAVPFRKLRAVPLLVLGVLALAAFVPMSLRDHGTMEAGRAKAEAATRLEAAGLPVPEDLAAAKKNWEDLLASVPPKPETVQKEIDLMRGGYGKVFTGRWDYHHRFQSVFLYYHFLWDVLGMMFLGMGLMKLGFFAGRSPKWVYGTMLAAGIGVTAAWFAWAWAWRATGFSPGAIELRLLHDLAYPFARGIAGLAWAAAFLLLLRAGRARWLTTQLAAVGRMAFSNYIVQTVCCTLLFFGYGFGLYGRLSRAELLLVVLAVAVVQVLFSRVWLRFFAFGPLEWAWRSLTWWRLQPLRRPAG